MIERHHNKNRSEWPRHWGKYLWQDLQNRWSTFRHCDSRRRNHFGFLRWAMRCHHPPTPPLPPPSNLILTTNSSFRWTLSLTSSFNRRGKIFTRFFNWKGKEGSLIISLHWKEEEGSLHVSLIGREKKDLYIFLLNATKRKDLLPNASIIYNPKSGPTFLGFYGRQTKVM